MVMVAANQLNQKSVPLEGQKYRYLQKQCRTVILRRKKHLSGVYFFMNIGAMQLITLMIINIKP